MKRIFAVIQLLSPAAAFGQSCPSGIVPPLNQQSYERKADGSEDFDRHCAPLALVSVFTLKKVSFSHSTKWGDVARVDVARLDRAGDMRVVCFKKPGDTEMQVATFDPKTEGCYLLEHHSGYFTIYPPMVGQH